MKKALIIILVLVSFNVKGQRTGSFTDSRDGKSYKTVEINGSTWMAENLAYYSSDSWALDEKVLGRYYSYKVAKEVCPTGWHLPSRREWLDVLDGSISYSSDIYVHSSVKGFPLLHFTSNKNYYARNYSSKKQFLVREGVRFNKSGLNIIPASFWDRDEHKVQPPYEGKGLGVAALFWTSTAPNGYSAYRVCLDADEYKVTISPKDFDAMGFSVRCVKDK